MAPARSRVELRQYCCIMSELEIRVRTRLRKQTDIGQVFPECCWTNDTYLDCSNQYWLGTLYYPVKNKVTIELDSETIQMMQKENFDDACIDVEISDDEVMMDGEEESDTFESFDSSPLSASVHSQTNNATSSPINIPSHSGQEGPRTRRTSSGGTPTHNLSYLGRMFPGAHCDSSPLSSGYGSAPRYFQSASTQTPSTPVFCETLIRLRISSMSGNTNDARSQHIRRQRLQMQERRARSRVYSENNGDDLRVEEGEEGNEENTQGSLGMPLPDLVAFRDRSNSAPTNLMRPEIRVGRQLRRISDEFHLSYHDHQRLRARQQQTILQRLLNTLRGHHHSHREGSAV
ncbi:uncharacterized protein LOC110980625 isoform X2 [Acanthaster planci]|uniref:Uncharacterized protein LOC110980625 isoform X2 n=1 Tax=Acanthaster planci TaxID=133434 RepID=A0A8B7YL57_ACAPL|nr:uncharacterized protein LOC110980625 isoform X2 [Acanthaster planci]